MDREVLFFICLVVASSGCMAGDTGSEGFLSEFDSNVLQLDSQDQEASFTLDRTAEEYTVQVSSPQSAEDMFVDVGNRTQHLRRVCGTLQERMYQLGVDQDVEGQKSFDILNKNGEMLKNDKSVNMTEFAVVLDQYELSQVRYDVSSERGEIAASCFIENKEPQGLKINIYDS